MTKKIFATISVALALVLGVVAPANAVVQQQAQTPKLVDVNYIADDPVPAAANGHYWKKISDWYYQLGPTDNNWMKVRLAMQVNYINGVAHDVRSYHAVTCTVNGRPDQGGDPYPCSYLIYQRLDEKIVGGNVWDPVDGLGTDMNNTGADGFYSRYGHWYLVAGHCDNFRVWAFIDDQGLAGYVSPYTEEHTTPEWSYC